MGQALGSDSTPLQLLLIEDDEEVRRSFQLLLQGHGYEVRAFAGARSAMAGDHSPFDVMICDYRLPDGACRMAMACRYCGRCAKAAGRGARS